MSPNLLPHKMQGIARVWGSGPFPVLRHQHFPGENDALVGYSTLFPLSAMKDRIRFNIPFYYWS